MTSYFGFRDRVHHDPEESAAIRRAATELLDGRTTLAKIAAEWTRLGLRRRLVPQKPWDGVKVWQVLTQDRVGGVVRRDGVIVDEAPTWLPILTRTQADGLRAMLRENEHRERTMFNGTDLARGIAKCRCGRDMLIMGGGRHRQYTCISKSPQHRENDGTRHVTILDHMLDGVLREAALDLLGTHGIDLLSYTPRSTSELNKMLGAARNAIDRARASTDDDAPLQLREAEHAAALLDAERDDRLLFEALAGLDPTNTTTLAASWDGTSLSGRHTILRRTLAVTVEAGRGAERVKIDSLLS